MKLRTLFFIVLLAALAVIDAAAQCDGERWNVKIGHDADAGLVDLNTVIPTTIAALTSIQKPQLLPDDHRIPPTETTLWSLSATLVKYARSFDSDYHIVFRDGNGRTMIAEIPDPNCVSTSSPFRPGIAKARAQFDAVLTATSTFQDANIAVTITGVGFFDHFEGQLGIAENGIELHPIIDIQFGATFKLAASPSSVTVSQGATSYTSVTSTLFSGFNSPLSLSAEGLPAGVTASFSPATIGAPGSGTSVLSLAADPGTAAGTYNVTITAAGGAQTRSLTLNLTVTNGGQQLLGDPGFESGASGSPWTATTGVIDGSSYMTAHTGAWKAWLGGFGSTHTDTLVQQVAVPSSATSATLKYWKHIETAENAARANDTVKVRVRNSAGTVLKTLASYSNLDSNPGYSQDAFDLSVYAGQVIQIYIVATENSSQKTSFAFDDFSLTVTGGTASDLAVSASPASLPLGRGSSGQTVITTTVSDAFNSAVSLSASGLPGGVTASFSPSVIAQPGSGSSVMNISVGETAVAGTYPVQVTASAGGLVRSTPLALTITSSGGTTSQLLGNPGFENGSSNVSPWSTTSGVIDNSSYQAAHGGSWKAWLNGYGSVHIDTLYQQVSIPSNATKATLSFWRHIDTTETTTSTAYDTLKVQIRNSSGTVLTTLATYSNLNAAPGFTQVSFDLASYKGQTIRVYLLGTEDSSLKTSFVVDDFALNVTTP